MYYNIYYTETYTTINVNEVVIYTNINEVSWKQVYI